MEKTRAEELAKEQREISVSEFFMKNRHLLGFDNPIRALLTTIKELVDNSLDACDDMKVLPDIKVDIKKISEDRFRVVVEDNGPGIVKEQIPKVFAKLLYGSKFFRIRQSRGQQGIGVCMTPDTLIPLGDGKVLPIKDIVENKLSSDLFVLSPDLKLGLGKVNKFWKIPSPPYLMDLKVLGGRSIRLTPENEVLIRNENGFEWKDAQKIKIGDYIAISRKLAPILKKIKVPIFDFLDEDTRIDNYDFILDLLYRLKKKYNTWYKVGKKFGLDKEQIKGWCKKRIRRRPTKKILKRFCDDLGISKRDIIKNCRKVGKLGNYVNIPKYVNKDFMSFLGYISGDGYSQPSIPNRWGRNISLWNDDVMIRRDFNRIVSKLFGIKTKLIEHSKGRGKMVQFSSSLVARLINKFGIPSGKKFNKFELDPLLHRKDFLRPYIRALFDCEASVSTSRNTINFLIRNKKMVNQISLFLLQFGIVSRINKLREDIRLIISGEKNIKLFNKEIGFLHFKKRKQLEEILKNNLTEKQNHLEKIPFVMSQIKSLMKKLSVSRSDLPYPHVISNRKIFSFPILMQTYNFLLSKIKDRNNLPIELQELYCLLNSDIFFVPVIKKRIRKSLEPFVYDLTMKQGNSFIANGILAHNSASVLYAQMTTGHSTKITSTTGKDKKSHYYELHIDTAKNEPEILKETIVDWDKKHGTRVELELEAQYIKGRRGVEEYLKEVAMVNPHLMLIYKNPEGKRTVFQRATQELPREPKQIKPHPYGVEIGTLLKMMKVSKQKKLKSFLVKEFSRVSTNVADKILEQSELKGNISTRSITRAEADAIIKAINKTKIIAPALNCLSPIGPGLLEKGLRKEVKADFYATISRPPSVYRGFPFQIECGAAYGGELKQDESIRILRFANKVPLLYQQSACAATKSITGTNWRGYGLSQSRGSIPIGPVLVAVHIASVWVPFTSESKEAIAHYPEIIKQVKLALQDVGRKLGGYIRQKKKREYEAEKKSYIQKYIPHIGEALQEILGLKDKDEKNIEKVLKDNLERNRT